MGIISNIFGKKKAEANASVDFEVSMSCMNCVKHVKDLLATSQGVVSSEIDLPTKKVSIQYDKEMTDVSKLQKSIEDLGFTVIQK